MSLLNKTFCRISVKLLNIAKYSAGASHNTEAFIFKSNFTTKEEEKVLNILNASSSDQLANFSVSKSRIKNLEMWKTKKGPFRSLSDVLEVEGLGEKVLEKICENIISDKNDKANLKRNHVINKRLKQLVSPQLSADVIREIHSVVGIHLGPIGISWAELTQGKNELNNWNYEDFGELPKKMMPTDTFDLAIKIIQKLPPGDIYVLEANPSMSPQATSQNSAITSYTQQIELTSMLIALLNTSVYHNRSLKKNKSSDLIPTYYDNKVYHLRAKLPARLFKTLIGTERVSALTTIMELVQNDGKGKVFSLPCTPIIVNDQLKNVFLSESSSNKELMGQALMLVVSFMDFCVYKSPVSLAALTPSKNNKK